MLSVLGVNIAVLDVEPQSGGVQVAGLVPGTLHGERILRGTTRLPYHGSQQDGYSVIG